MKKSLSVILVSLFLGTILETSATVTKSINVLVFEGRPYINDNDSDLITKNIKAYKDAVPPNSNPQIIVLPEYGLTGLQTENLDKFANEITNATSNKNISALNDFAKASKAYVVANLLEKDGDDYYSTTIVVNGTAQLVAKYRKINVNDTEKNLKSGGDSVTFDTEVGKVGLLSGEDILYDNPSQKILSDASVTAVIYTAAFKSIAPYRTALSIQQGYAQANGINLLVANLNDPSNGFSGSGIYSKDQILQQYIDANNGTVPLSSSIDIITDKRDTSCPVPPKKVNGIVNLFTNFATPMLHKSKDIYQFNLTYSPGELVTAIVQGDLKGEKLCDGSFCCTFNATSAKWKNETEKHRMVVRGGDNPVCALVLCDGKGENCGKLTKTVGTSFNFIQITISDSDRAYRPYTLNNKLQPIDTKTNPTYFCSNSSVNTVFNVTGSSISDVVVVAIVTDSGASSLQVFVITNLFAIVFVLKYLFH